MRKIHILLLILLLLLSGCAGENRLDSSGVQVAWLEDTRPTEPPPTMPTPPAETEPVQKPRESQPEETGIPENTEAAPTEAPAEMPTEPPYASPCPGSGPGKNGNVWGKGTECCTGTESRFQAHGHE